MPSTKSIKIVVPAVLVAAFGVLLLLHAPPPQRAPVAATYAPADASVPDDATAVATDDGKTARRERLRRMREALPIPPPQPLASHSSPEAVVRTYYQAMKDAEFDVWLRCHTPEAAAAMLLRFGQPGSTMVGNTITIYGPPTWAWRWIGYRLFELIGEGELTSPTCATVLVRESGSNSGCELAYAPPRTVRRECTLLDGRWYIVPDERDVASE